MHQMRIFSFLSFLFFMQTALASPPTATPHWLKTFRIAIDAGHGGHDVGTLDHSGKVAEKDLALSVAKKLSARFKSLGVASLLTREKDEYLTLEERAHRANQFQATAFVSLHVNSSASGKDAGIETYILKQTTNERALRLANIENDHHRTDTLALILSDMTSSANEADSARLACEIQTTMVEHLSEAHLLSRDRLVKQSLFYLLMKTEMPSILVELGFLSHPKEKERLMNDRYQERLSLALFHGILKYAKNAGGKTKLPAGCRGLSGGK